MSINLSEPEERRRLEGETRPPLQVDIHNYARGRVIPVTELLLDELSIKGFAVQYRPGVWSTHVHVHRRHVQFGERCLQFGLMGAVSCAGRKLFNDETRAHGVRDGHDMVAATICHEVGHLEAVRRSGTRAGHDPFFWHVHRELFDRYGKLIGDLLRGTDSTQGIAFLAPDPEIIRFREFFWGEASMRQAPLAPGTEVIVESSPGCHTFSGIVVADNGLSCCVRAPHGLFYRVWKWSRISVRKPPGR